jgi:hypothetical protein
LQEPGRRDPDLCGVDAAEADRLWADWIDQPASAAERNLFEIRGVAQLTGGEEGLPSRLVHFAALVVRQTPCVGADLVGVAHLVAVCRMGRNGDRVERSRAGISDLQGAAPKRGVQRTRLRGHGLPCCRGDRGHAQRWRKRGANGQAGTAEQLAAAQGGTGRRRRRSRAGFGCNSRMINHGALPLL